MRRFRRESRITARLEHPGVPAVYDWGEEDGQPFLVMQRVRGIDLDHLLSEQGPLPIGWAAAIAAQVCSVLSAAHEAGLIHRDLKPSNLMAEPHGTVKVLDFGLAVAPTLSDFSKITQTGQAPGTPAYMAPEQIEANEVSPASDLYALGCILHEMLAGKRPFDASTPYLLSKKHVSEPPPALRDLRAEVPIGLERLVLDLLAKKPEDRPADAALVHERLLPFVRDLGPIPRVLDSPTRCSPIQMYGIVLGRVYAEPPPAAPTQAHQPASAPVPSQPSTASSVLPDGSRSSPVDLRRSRDEASRLAAQSRYRQAAELLAADIALASRVAGDDAPDVVESRLQLADMWFDAGDYRTAAAIYVQVADQLDGPEHLDRVMHCRRREAACWVRIGETSQALRKLRDLLREVQPVLGDDDPHIAALRRDIGMLQLSSGQRHAAREQWRPRSPRNQ